MSIQQIADTYSHIELTEDEMLEAIVWAKQKKEAAIKEAEFRTRQEENRKIMTQNIWDVEVVKNFAINRANSALAPKPLILDYHSQALLQLLSLYFANDSGFVDEAKSQKVNNPSLDKGLLLSGNNGVGKSFFMQIFQRNRRQCFWKRNALVIANAYDTKEPKDGLAEYLEPYTNSSNDPDSFFQPYCGLCIEDMGTEEVKNNFGNKANVVGTVLELRYDKKLYGTTLHGTTNLTVKQLQDFYGNRVLSRMREMFNYIVVGGEDRRK